MRVSYFLRTLGEGISQIPIPISVTPLQLNISSAFIDIKAVHGFSEAFRTNHWPLFRNCPNIRGREPRGCMNRIYQWLSSRASFFRPDASSRGTSRTVRTEVTVERQGIALLPGGGADGLDACPLCRSKLPLKQSDQPEPPSLRLQEGSISELPSTEGVCLPPEKKII
jgi:hypothetical protein